MVIHAGHEHLTREERRLEEDKKHQKYWRRWGPYVSERQWATVREDYSDNGDAWSYFPHDHARSRAYRWGEDGIAGVSDNHQMINLSFAFWNGQDEILKERLYGLTGHQGNHGEDVKEEYFHLDNVPSHSYMKYLYKYPQTKFPYKQLVAENAKRSRLEPEYELMDTGVFDEDRYFDIFIETAKRSENEEDILFRVTAYNRGPDPAPIHIIPQIWFRNRWSFGLDEGIPIPSMEKVDDSTIHIKHFKYGDRYLQISESPGVDESSPDVMPTFLFTENNTNNKRLWKSPNETKYVKDAFHDYIVDGVTEAVNPDENGTKGCAWFPFDQGEGVPPGECVVVRFKFTNEKPTEALDEVEFDYVFDMREDEADDFYEHLSPLPISEDLRNIQRQAFSGLLWCKQYYSFIQPEWINGDPKSLIPPPANRRHIRNEHWRHLHIDDILSMPDKWEYPFFAAWDLAFHCVPIAMIDPEFAKKQLDVMTREWYMHPNGQLPAYEWNFSDVNPPVHAWATFRVFKIERKIYGRSDYDFLERVFQKLLLNFTWWVNRKDSDGNNVFEGGFMGLDNIGIFNRSEPLPTGGKLYQADSTGWMAFYCLCMLNISLELSLHRSIYEDIASKFFEHFLFIADAIGFDPAGDCGKMEQSNLWNKEDGFYYDMISWGGPNRQSLPVKSLVGLIPLYATITLEPDWLKKNKSFQKRLDWFVANRPEMSERNIASMTMKGKGERLLLSLLSKERLQSVLQKLLDENEFLSDYGIRSLSLYHKTHPYKMEVKGQTFGVHYVPGDSDSPLFGGNSNWRGPIWFPTTFLLIESLQRFFLYYGDTLKVEFPTRSGNLVNLAEAAEHIQHRLLNIFVRDPDGRRACNGNNDIMNHDENWRDYLHFGEFFHADDGHALGATHQCGWTALIAKVIQDTGLSKTMEGTPQTPGAAAEVFFDDVMPRRKSFASGSGSSTPGRIHIRRRSSRANLKSMDSFNSNKSDKTDTESHDSTSDEHMLYMNEHVARAIKGLRRHGTSHTDNNYQDELEANVFKDSESVTAKEWSGKDPNDKQ